MRSPFALLLTVAVLGACQSAPPVPDDFPPPGGTYYTQYSLFYERGHHQTTNFRASRKACFCRSTRTSRSAR